MTIAKNRPMTLEEYLAYDDGTDSHRYELWDGILVEMGAESDINVVIRTFLILVFSQLTPYKRVRYGTEIEVHGNLANTRFPDLLVLTEEGLLALADKSRSMLTLDMPAPSLAVEMVSSSDTNRTSRERDYINKRHEYAQRGILEYWIVDPIAAAVLVLTLSGETYTEAKLTGNEKVVSRALPNLDLSAEQILRGEL